MAAFRNRRIFAGAVAAALLIGAGIWLGARTGAPTEKSEGTDGRPSKRSTPGKTANLVGSPSRYLNTKADARFVGSDACIECHRDQHASFVRTPHSQALADIDLTQEPSDVEFRHQKSGRVFQVYRRDGALRHREFLPDAEQGNITIGDYAVANRIGSGNHSRSYLIEIDGFLVESPITWYASKNKWAVSPGYDTPRHPSFTRPAHEGCVHCHAGRAHSVGGGTHRLRFEEQKIGCESCHGPGSLHVKQRRNDAVLPDGIDYTIVNPADLTRDLNEAICGRCHLRGKALANVRGRSRNDFRPGLPLTDFRIDYRAALSAKSMSVVGHFEQLQASRCYASSKTMTCTTCHNPHASPTSLEKVSYYRDKCQSCHDSDRGCRLAETTRLKKSPQNDCVACHMPKAETDIPHFAFTHHRIGLKQSLSYSKQKSTVPLRLIPMSDVSQLSKLDRERCLGLAYLQIANAPDDDFSEVYQQRALNLLGGVYQAGLRDGALLAALARLHWNRNQKQCLDFARAALKSTDCPPAARVNALIVLGDTHLGLGEIEPAKSAFLKLTRLRRASVDWRMLGICESQDNDSKSAIASFLHAISIRPDDPDLRRLLAREAARAGKRVLANEHLKTAKRLEALQPRFPKPPP